MTAVPPLTWGLNQMAQHRIFARKELLAENLRLLYVALTRAPQPVLSGLGTLQHG